MLKVFWVEDNTENIDEYTNYEFEELFGKPIVPSSFQKTFETLEDSLAYDFVVIDIDLSKFSDKNYLDELKNKIFPATTNNSEGNYNSLIPENAGLFVFNKLLEKGFPKERILFLTANAGSETNTYDTFNSHFRNSLISLPNYILKDNDGADNLVKYIKEKTIDYLVLRRGVIEGCKFLKGHIEEDDDRIQFRDFIKLENNEPSIEISTIEIKNYLDALIQSLPAKQPINDSALKIQYRLFLRTLTHEWEESIEPYSLRRKYGNDLGKVNDIFSFAWIMKIARNWVSHANLLEPLNAEILAFLTLINMRAMFKLSKTESYEAILLGCFDSSTNIDTKTLGDEIKLSKTLIDERLTALKISLTFKNKYDKEENKHFGKKINDIYRHNTGNPDAEDYDYKKLLMQYFWVNQEKTLKSKLGKQESDEFLPKLAHHIYSLSFLED